MADFSESPEIIKLGADASDLVAAAGQIDQLASAIERLDSLMKQAPKSETGSTGDLGIEKQIELLRTLGGAYSALGDVEEKVLDAGKFVSESTKKQVAVVNLRGELQAIVDAVEKAEAALAGSNMLASGTAKEKKLLGDRLQAIREFKKSAESILLDSGLTSGEDLVQALIGGKGKKVDLLKAIVGSEADLRGRVEAMILPVFDEVQQQITQAIDRLDAEARKATAGLSSVPRGARLNVQRQGRERAAAREAERIADLEGRARSAASTAKSDVVSSGSLGGADTKDVAEFKKRIQAREREVATLIEGTRASNNKIVDLRSEQTKLRDSLAIARQNEGAITSEEAKADIDRRARSGDTSSRVYKIRVPGPQPEDIPKIQAEINRVGQQIEALRTGAKLNNERLTAVLSSDPLAGIKLPKPLKVSEIKKLIAERMVAAEIIRSAKAGKPLTDQEIEEFKLFIGQQGTGAAAVAAKELVDSARSSDPVLDAVMKAAEARERDRSARSRGRSTESKSRAKRAAPSGLDASGKAVKEDLAAAAEELKRTEKDIQSTEKEVLDAKRRLDAAVRVARQLLGNDEVDSALGITARKGGSAAASVPEISKEAEIDLARNDAAVGAKPDKGADLGAMRTKEILRKIKAAMQTEVEVVDSEGNETTRKMTREEAIQAIQDDMDASESEMTAARKQLPEQKAIMSREVIRGAVERIVQIANNKMKKEDDRAMTDPEIEQLSSAIDNALTMMSEGRSTSISEGDSDKDKSLKKKILELLTKFRVVNETLDATQANLSGDTKELVGRPGQQGQNSVDLSLENAEFMASAQREAEDTGKKIEDIIRERLEIALEEKALLEKNLRDAKARKKELETQTTDTSYGRSPFLDMLGVGDERMGQQDPLALIRATLKGDSKQKMRLKQRGFAVPEGLTGMAVSSIGRDSAASTEEDDFRRTRPEQIEGTTGAAGVAENPVRALFTKRSVNPNTQAGAQLNVETVAPAEAGDALEFLTQLFDKTTILVADLADTLAVGRDIKPNDVDQLAINLGLLGSAFDAVQDMSGGKSPERTKKIGELKAQFEKLASEPAIKQLFSPEFIGAGVRETATQQGSAPGALRSTGEMSTDQRVDVAEQLLEVAKALMSTGGAVVGKMQEYAQIAGRSPAGSGAARLSSGEPTPATTMDALPQLRGLAADALTGNGAQSAAQVQDDLATIIADLVAKGELLPSDFLAMVTDPEAIQKIKDAATAAYPGKELERLPTMLASYLKAELEGSVTPEKDESGAETGNLITKLSRYERQFTPEGRARRQETGEAIKLPGEIREEIRAELEKEMKGRGLGEVSDERLTQLMNQTVAVGYKRGEGGQRVDQARMVNDPVGQQAAAKFAEQIVQIEEILIALAEATDSLATEGETAAFAEATASAQEESDARVAALNEAQARIAIIQSRIRINKMRRSVAPEPATSLKPGQGDMGPVGATVAMLETEKEIESRTAADIRVPKPGDYGYEDYQSVTDRLKASGAISGDVSAFKRVSTAEDIAASGAPEAVSFDSIPPRLLSQLIAADPSLAGLETPNNPMNTLDTKPGDVKGPAGGKLVVPMETAVKLVKALAAQGVFVSMAKVFGKDKKEHVVAVQHVTEELKDDPQAALIADIVKSEIEAVGSSSNAITSISTPEYTSSPRADKDQKLEVGEGLSSRGGIGGADSSMGFQFRHGAARGGSARHIQIPRMSRNPAVYSQNELGEKTIAYVGDATPKLTNSPVPAAEIAHATGHEFGHAQTIPGGMSPEGRQKYISSITEMLQSMGVDLKMFETISNYAATAPLEALAEAYTMLRGFSRDAGSTAGGLGGSASGRSLLGSIKALVSQKMQESGTATSLPTRTQSSMREEPSFRKPDQPAEQAPAPADDFEQKLLEELAGSPNDELAKQNYVEYLQLSGLTNAEIKRKLTAAGLVKEAATIIADAEEAKAETAQAAAAEPTGKDMLSGLTTPREAETGLAEELGVSTEELATLTPGQTEGLIRQKQERDMAKNAKRDEERLKTAGSRAEAARKKAKEVMDPRARLETPMEAQIDEGAEVGLSPDEAVRVDPSVIAKRKKEADEAKIAELNAADDARRAKILKDQIARRDAADARAAAAKKAKDDRAAAEAAEAETARKAAEVASGAASAAEDELGLFEDYAESEYGESDYGDGESTTYEPVDDSAEEQRRNDAEKRVVEAKAKAADVAEKVAAVVEAGTAKSEQAAGPMPTTGAPVPSATPEAAIAAPGGGDSTGPQYAQAREELLQTLLAALGNEKAAYELSDAFERVNANFFNQEKAVRDQILANLVAQLQSEEVKKSLAGDAARLEEIQSGEAKKQLEALIAAGASQQEIADAVEYYEQQAILHYVNMAKQQAQEELNMREAQFRTTSAGMKINKKTGEYVNDRPSPLYGESSREGVMLRNAGFEMDPQLKAYTEAQLVLFEKLYAGIMDIASATATSPRDISTPGGGTRPETEDEIRARLVAGNAASRAVIRGGATEGDLLAMAKDAAKTNQPNALTASSIGQLLDALTALGGESGQITGRFNALASGQGVGISPEIAAATSAADALTNLANAAKVAGEEVKGNVVYSSGGGAGGGGKPPTKTGGAGDENWRNIRAEVPDTNNISRGLEDLAKLQNRFNELNPTIVHARSANAQFSKSLEDSGNAAEKASATLAKLTNANVGLIKTVKTQVGRAATFLVLQQMGREIGGVIEHLQSGVFQFNQVLENTTVGFNTLFANTLQARAQIGNELVPKLNEAGQQIGFMRTESVKFSDAINYTSVAAENMVAEIRQIANVTPFRFQPLVEASLKMKAFGFEAAEIPGMINSISNAVAALGGNDEKIDRIAYALGQMNSAGRVYQNDMMQLANAGVAGYRMLSEKLLMDLTAMKQQSMGIMKNLPEETTAEFARLAGMLNSASFKKSFGSIDEMIRTLEDPKRAEGLIRNLAKRGFLIGSTAARAITEGMDKQYQGSADRLSRTMTGALSTIADLSQNFMATAFSPLYASVRDTIVEVGQFMLKSKEITIFVDKVRDRMEGFIKSLAAFGPALQSAGQIFINIFVGGFGAALDKGTAFGGIVTSIINNLGPGLKMIGDILTNDVGRGLAVAATLFSIFSKAVTSNPMIATVLLVVTAISGIAKALQDNTLLVGSFVKTFVPAIEQLLTVIGDAFTTIMIALTDGGLVGFIGGLSVAVDLLMPLLVMFLTTMAVILKVITPLAGPLGFIVGIFLALKTAMMAFDLAGSLIGKVMTGIGGAWNKTNELIDSQTAKVKQTAAAYEELRQKKIAADDYRKNSRGEYLDADGKVVTDKSKAALKWGAGEKVESYGMTERKGEIARGMMEGRGGIPGILFMDRKKQEAMDAIQNSDAVRPDFGKGFSLTHKDTAAGHTVPIIDNKTVERNYGYLDSADAELAQFKRNNQAKIDSGTLDAGKTEELRNLEERARLKQEASKSGMFRFAGSDMGQTDAKANTQAGAYSMDNMMGAILVQKETNWILTTTFTKLEEAGNQILSLQKELTAIESDMTAPGAADRKAAIEGQIAGIRKSQEKNMAIIGGLAEAGVPDLKGVKLEDFGGRGISIPPGAAAGINKMPEKVRNIIMAEILKRYTKGEVFATKEEQEKFAKEVLGDARGKSFMKASSVGVLQKAGNAVARGMQKITSKMPTRMVSIERGGADSGMQEIDSRDGQYYYVDEETGQLSNKKVSKKELEKRKRMKGFDSRGVFGKFQGAVKVMGMGAAAAGLAVGSARLAGQIAPIMAAPIIGPLMNLLPKEFTNVFRQKAGPFQAMAAGIGSTAGAMLGQALIPIPGVGAALGGMIGSALGELVGNAIDRAIEGSEAAMQKKKEVMEEAKFLGFDSEESKRIGAAAAVRDGQNPSGIPFIVSDPADSLADTPNLREANSARYGAATENAIYEQRQAALGGFMDSGIGKALIGTPIGGTILGLLVADGIAQNITGEKGNGILGLGIGGESKEQLDAFTAFQKKQAEFMETAMPLEDLKELYGEEAIFTKQRLYDFKMTHGEEMKLIEGKIAQGQDLTLSEERLRKEFDKLTAAAASSPMGVMGTYMNKEDMSPTMLASAINDALTLEGRGKYTKEEAEASDGKFKEGDKKDGFTSLMTLMQNPDLLFLTRGAGFGTKTEDALNAADFDFSKITKDMDDKTILKMFKEALKPLVQARVRGKELTPKVDLRMTRTEMMAEYGGNAGYDLFDKYEKERGQYLKQQKQYDAMGGDERLDELQSFADRTALGPDAANRPGAATGAPAPVAGVAPTTSTYVGGRSVTTRANPEAVAAAADAAQTAGAAANLLTVQQEMELAKLIAAQKALTDARYQTLTVDMSILTSLLTDGAARAAATAKEKAFITWKQTNNEALKAAIIAGKNATAEQLALLDLQKTKQAELYTTKAHELNIGDALQAAEAAGLNITNKDLANNQALVELLLAKQQLINDMGGTAAATVTQKAAELNADKFILQASVYQLEVENKTAEVLAMQAELLDTDVLTASRRATIQARLNVLNGAGADSIAASQKMYDDLSAKAAKWLTKAAEANPTKLQKKDIDAIKKMIAKDPGSILGGDGGSKDTKALEKQVGLLQKMASIASQAYERIRKAQQRTHDEYIKQLDEQEKRINERYQQRSDIQTEENLQAQLQISGLQMRSASADPLEAAKSFYDAKQALEQFYIDKQRDAELKVVSDEKERYEKEYTDTGAASQAIYDAALTRMNSRFDFAQKIISGDEAMQGKMNDSLRMTMFGGADEATMQATMEGKPLTSAATALAEFQLKNSKKIKLASAKKWAAKTTADKALLKQLAKLRDNKKREDATNATIAAATDTITGLQDITMTTTAQEDLSQFESTNRDVLASAQAENADQNAMVTWNEDGQSVTGTVTELLASLSEKQDYASQSQSSALIAAVGKITGGIDYNASTPFDLSTAGFSGGIKGLSYGGNAVDSTADAKKYLKVYRGSTEESGLMATFMNEAIGSKMSYQDGGVGKTYSGVGNILAYLTGKVNALRNGITDLNAEQRAMYEYSRTLVSSKNTFTSDQKTAILAQRTIEQALNDFQQSTGVDINVGALAEADVTDKQFNDYFAALGQTFEDSAAREAAIEKMRETLRDTYGQALLSFDVEAYSKFASSSDDRIGVFSTAINDLKDVMGQVEGVMSSSTAKGMTTLDKLLFGANFDPHNISGAGNPISNLQFGKTQIDSVTTAVAATRDAFESSMNSIKSYAEELSGPLGAFNQQSVTGADALTTAMGQTASSFSLATGKVKEYATALAAAAAARASLGVNATLATGLATSATPTSATITAGANNTFNITVSNANNMDAQQLAAELARLIARQAGSSVN